MNMVSAGVLTISDSCFSGERKDESGELLAQGMAKAGYSVVCQTIVPDDKDAITAKLVAWCEMCDLILTTGGTGFAPRDVTPEATRRILEREAPGLCEVLRAEGCRKTLYAALSRGVAGIRGSTLIINLPGSPKAVTESLQTLQPLLPHALDLISGRPTKH